MRPIKFRAWNKEFHEMLRVDQITFEENVIARYKPHILDEHNDIHSLEEIELMQFTGSKDENGVDIYEGDVVIFAYEEFHRIITWGKIHGGTSDISDWSAFYAEIIFYEGHIRGLERSILLNAVDATRIKVIGNKYEDEKWNMKNNQNL